MALHLVEREVGRAVAPGFARNEGDTLSMPVTGGYRLTPNFASLSQRRQPVDLIAFATVDDVYRIKLPPGAKVYAEFYNPAEVWSGEARERFRAARERIKK